ncbi:MAG: hypothetical protein DWI02_02915 [Planctomycetota bacterium]|nr:MAG: hypothetical protein DWI02_02915 [Planctomycetota bacterium]
MADFSGYDCCVGARRVEGTTGCHRSSSISVADVKFRLVIWTVENFGTAEFLTFENMRSIDLEPDFF